MISKRFPSSRCALVSGLIVASALFVALASPASATREGVVQVIEVTGYIDPPAARFIEERVNHAQTDGASALLIRISSPGGISAPIAHLVSVVEGSRVPVVIWVAPIGARASGAAALLLSSAHVAVMAPGSIVGRAALTNFGEPAQTAKVAEMLARASLLHRRNPPFARSLATKTVTADEASREGFVTYLANSTPEVLEKLRGRAVSVAGEEVRLPDSFTITFLKMGLFDKWLHDSSRPSIVILLLIIGVFGVVFELYNPGVGAAALAGGIAIAFGLYGATILPVWWPALGGIGVSVALFLLDLRKGGFGPYSVIGGALLAVSSSLLYRGSGLSVPIWMTALVVIMAFLYFVSVMNAAIRARTARPIVGSEAIVGSVATARTDISPSGQVFASGTLWRARTLGAAIAQGSSVRVRGISGLMLIVEETDEGEAES